MRRPTPIVAIALLSLPFIPARAQDARGGRGEFRSREDFQRRSDRSRRGGPTAREAESGDGTYELRGFFGAGLRTQISLRQSGSDKAYWIRIGENVDGIYVEKVDPVVGTAVIVTRGTRYKLRLAGEIPEAMRPAPQILAGPEAAPSGQPVVQAVTLTAASTGGGTVVIQSAAPAQPAQTAQAATSNETPPPPPPPAP